MREREREREHTVTGSECEMKVCNGSKTREFYSLGFWYKMGWAKVLWAGPNLNGLRRLSALINIVIANKILGLFGHLFWNQDSCFC